MYSKTSFVRAAAAGVRIEDRRVSRRVRTDNLNAGVAVVKSAQHGA